MASMTLPIQVASITTSLMAAGSIATMSFFDIPQAQSQPASRSLPMIRWLFSRGSHIFPTTTMVSFTGFLYLAITTLPAGRAWSTIYKVAANSPKVNAYIAAAFLNLGTGIFTERVMIPTNFSLIELNERLGGAKSEKSAKNKQYGTGDRSADDSVNSKGDPTSQWTDLSGPQSQTDRKSSPEEDREANELLTKFGRLNAIRACFPGIGGVVGLVVALM